jgi:hypothetical protein
VAVTLFEPSRPEADPEVAPLFEERAGRVGPEKLNQFPPEFRRHARPELAPVCHPKSTPLQLP